MENRQALRDPSYSLADRCREEEALRTAVDMLAPEHRPLCAFPLGDAPEVRLEYPHHHWLYTDDRPEPLLSEWKHLLRWARAVWECESNDKNEWFKETK